MSFKNWKILLVVVISLSLLSCFGGGASIPEDHYYRLPELSATKIATPILNGTLSIKRVITYGIYGERTLIYTEKNSSIKLNRYHYHHWEKSPSKLLQDHLLQYLKKVGIASQVISRSQNTTSDYLLEAELITMHRDMTTDGYVADISLDIRLYNKSNNSMYINKRYHAKKIANSNKLIDTILAYSDGLNTIYNELIVDLQSEHFNKTTSQVTFQPAKQ